MNELFSPETWVAAPRTDRVFVALFPDAQASAHINRMAPQLREQHQLRGKLRPPSHFHITLSHLDDYAGLPTHIVQAASQACLASTASTPPFDVKLDCVKSFGGKPGNRPFILCDNSGNSDLRNFQKRLVAELAKHGCPSDKGAFTPHLTLLYDDKIIPRAPIDPVRWMAGEIVLVHSLLGKTRYFPLGCWPLGGQAQPALSGHSPVS